MVSQLIEQAKDSSTEFHRCIRMRMRSNRPSHARVLSAGRAPDSSVLMRLSFTGRPILRTKRGKCTGPRALCRRDGPPATHNTHEQRNATAYLFGRATRSASPEPRQLPARFQRALKPGEGTSGRLRECADQIPFQYRLSLIVKPAFAAATPCNSRNNQDGHN